VHLLGLAFLSEPGSFGEISLWRPEGRERHGTEELKIANVLARHLQRAFGIAHRVQATSTRAAQLEAMFERLAVGCLLINASGRLILANAAAEALLRRNEPLRLAGGRVWADTAANRSKWERLLSGLGSRAGPCQGTAVTLETADGASLRLLAVPLKPARSDALGFAPPSLHLGLVTICDPTPLPSDAGATLQRLFGLTPAEANLAIAVFGGESLHEYADRHERSLNTIKTHLRGIFAKTGTNRQAELVRKLAGLAMLAR
jgi:DNA-binding CsgD family transcriptional regulator/PAS domain-containing protein